MITTNSGTTDPQASASLDPKAGAPPAVPLLDPSKPIEVASSGNGTTNDTSGTGRPPGAYDTDAFA